MIELLIQKIQILSIETQHLLKLASCIGNIFDLKTLAIISNRKPNEILSALKVAIEEELIKIIQNNHQILFNVNDENKDISGISFQFQHDKVEQACFEKLIFLKEIGYDLQLVTSFSMRICFLRMMTDYLKLSAI